MPLCDRATDLDDLMQAGAIGVMRAEATYQPDKGKFASWASGYIQTEMQAALGLRGTRIRAHRGATSIDAPHGEEGGTLAETLLDPSADFENHFDRAEAQRVVGERVEALQDDEAREVVQRVYLGGETRAEAARELGISPGKAINASMRAFNALRKDASIRALAEAHGLDRRTNWHYHRGLSAWRSDWMSTTEKLAFWRMEQATDWQQK